MKFTIIKSPLARFSGIFALGTPSNIYGTAISYRCAKIGAFVNSVVILTLRDLTTGRMFGLVYNPWERVTTSHHGSQVSLFLLLTGTVLSLVSLLSPTMLFSG